MIKTFLTIASMLILTAPFKAGALDQCQEEPALCDLVIPKQKLDPVIADLTVDYSPTDVWWRRLKAVENVANQTATVSRRQEIQLNLIERHDPDWRVVDAVTKIRRQPPSYFKSLLREKLETLFSESAKTRMFWLPAGFSERGRFIKAVAMNPYLERLVEVLWLYEKNVSAKTLLLEIGSKAAYAHLPPHPLSRAFIPQERARENGWWPYAGKRCEKLFDFTS